MKLEAKHIKAYPFGLKAMITVKGFNNEIVEITEISEDHVEVVSTLNFGEKIFEFADIKPILRPMSDLKYHFKPLYELLEYNDVREFLDEDFLAKHNIYSIDDLSMTFADDIPYGTLKVLAKHHFDIYGLIEKGLAVDINTLNNEI